MPIQSPETHQESQSGGESPMFEVGQEVTVRELRPIVAPQNILDSVEERRLEMVSSDVNELLRSDLPAKEAAVHRTNLYNLGAEVVLEYLPEAKAL